METDSLLASPSNGGDDNRRQALLQSSSSSPQNTSKHRLLTHVKGQSKIERLASKISTRRNNRIPVTFHIRVKFLEECQERASHEVPSGSNNSTTSQEDSAAVASPFHHRLHISQVQQWKTELERKIQQRSNIEQSALSSISTSFRGYTLAQNLVGVWDVDHAILKLLNQGLHNMNEIGGEWFWYRDFNFYYTEVVPASSWLRNRVLVATWVLLSFYFGSAIFFCYIIKDDGVCPGDPNVDLKRPYYGWLSAIYFASVTMSTVGYGDTSIAGGSNPEAWRLLIGAIYMPLSLLIAATVFATAAEAALAGFDATGYKWLGNIVESYDGNNSNIPLHKQVRRIFWYRVTQLILLFVAFNLVGMILFKISVRREFHHRDSIGDGLYNDNEHITTDEHDWSWMKTFYWAIQTTTTVGYGDLQMPFEMRWFQIFYTTFGTVLVGSVFAGVSSLTTELQDFRRYYAWKRREVSKQLIVDMKGTERCDGDNRIDQYEFLVGSLLMLNKIRDSDVEQIMNKFRDLSGDKGYIVFDDDHKHSDEDSNMENMGMDVNVDDRGSMFAR